LYFFAMILVGAGLGLLYAWVINPVRYVNTPLSSLRPDYQTDWTLMVAEVYSQENNLPLASVRLAYMSDDPAGLVDESLLTARQLGYSQRDIDLLLELQGALQIYQPLPTGGAP
jgi:hypothetical protein